MALLIAGATALVYTGTVEQNAKQAIDKSKVKKAPNG